MHNVPQVKVWRNFFRMPVVALLVLSVIATATAQTAKPAAPAVAEEEQQCFPYTEALSKVGQKVCIQGIVENVFVAHMGVVFLDFCHSSRNCEFTVVVLPNASRRIVDIRTLVGQEVRVIGKVRKRGHTAEITWEREDQLLVAYDQPPPEPEKKKKGKKKTD